MPPILPYTMNSLIFEGLEDEGVRSRKHARPAAEKDGHLRRPGFVGIYVPLWSENLQFRSYLLGLMQLRKPNVRTVKVSGRD